MTTLTLEYDSQNSIMQQLIDSLIERGARIISKKTEFEQSIDEFERGEITHCDNFDDFLSKIRS
ncbi:MAG: hypothetical protein J6I49_05610 [Bacteroidales bacterium]|nr:hypothetical protein [Bacteroidales bacterium]